MKAIILAAGRGSRMGNLTDSHPKCLTTVKGKPLIEYQIDALKKAGIDDIAIVTGYKFTMLEKYGTHHFHNERWAETNMVYSLSCAKEWLNTDDCIVSYSDIYYGSQIVNDLMNCPNDISIAYDPNWLELWSKRFEDPLDDAETFRINEEGYVTEIGQKPKTVEEIQGQYMGLLKFKKTFWKKFDLTFSDKISMTEFLQEKVLPHFKIKSISNKETWGEIDSAKDLLLKQ
jgi:choline kinase